MEIKILRQEDKLLITSDGRGINLKVGQKLKITDKPNRWTELQVTTKAYRINVGIIVEYVQWQDVGEQFVPVRETSCYSRRMLEGFTLVTLD